MRRSKRRFYKRGGLSVENEMMLSFLARSDNEMLARLAVTSFITNINPTIDELSEVKTIVSEAVSNAIIHGYEGGMGFIHLHAKLDGSLLSIVIKDEGLGIENIEQAMEPLYTTKPELERCGMGFTIMESFADHLQVESVVGKGTVITFTKQLCTIPTLVT